MIAAALTDKCDILLCETLASVAEVIRDLLSARATTAAMTHMISSATELVHRESPADSAQRTFEGSGQNQPFQRLAFPP